MKYINIYFSIALFFFFWKNEKDPKLCVSFVKTGSGDIGSDTTSGVHESHEINFR